jgi:NitT/TauT family transport system substrate-binding protein
MSMRVGALLGVAVLLSGVSAAQADPVKIRIGWATIPGSLGGYMTEKMDLLHHYGSSYTIEPVHFANSPVELTGLAADAVDIAELTYPPLGAAIENAKMDDIRLIESQIETDVPGYSSDQYMVLKTSTIQSLDDLKHKVVATNGIGAAGDVTLRYVMRKHGMEVQRDFNDVEVGFANMKSALIAGKIDMGMIAPPYVYDAGLLEIARPLPRTKDEIFSAEVTWAARAGFIAKNRAAMVDLIEDALRVTRWYNDPTHHAEAVVIVARLTKQQPADIDFVFTNRDFYRNPSGRPDLAGIQRNLDMEKALGVLKTAIDVTKYADLSLTDEAGARLK